MRNPNGSLTKFKVKNQTYGCHLSALSAFGLLKWMAKRQYD
jgi:hypothetical protein